MEPSSKYLILTCTFLLILGILLVMEVEEHKILPARIPPRLIIIPPKENYTYTHEYVVIEKTSVPGLYVSRDRVVRRSRNPPSMSKLWEYVYHIVIFKILDIKGKESKIPVFIIYPDNSTEKYIVGKGNELLVEVKKPGPYKIILMNPYNEALNITREIRFGSMILKNPSAPLGLILVVFSLITMACTASSTKQTT